MRIKHGGDWVGYMRAYGRLPLDFSASVSPLGLPAGVRAAVTAALDTADRYPDPESRALRAALSAHHGVPAENIICGGGAAELIYRLCRSLRPKKAVLFVPGFAEYEQALAAEGCEITRIALNAADFHLTRAALAGIPNGTELVFLCNPNNPTGLLAGRDTLAALLARCRETGAHLVADECFLDFCDRPGEHSLVPALGENPRLTVLKAFTKTYAMAGLRLGYALCGSAALAGRLRAAGQPWPVSSLAEAAGLAALQEKDYVNQLRALVASERKRLRPALEALGLRVIPGEANYLLFRSGDTQLAEKLRARGILLRDCADWAGLGAGWYRAAIRTPAENDALLAALGEVTHG